MRKGADCLSKWIGEAERQLRLLFDQAYRMQPSIIFFDEIDGLAPVRSSKQDQIHSSIVSTLLALLDGLDDRGQVIVIGATNRIDSIDPALRRPGRFDREFLFTLPARPARRDILAIHTASWEPRPEDRVLEKVAEKTVGYCGADLKSLCAEATLRALRRTYPQIYQSTERYLLDLNRIFVTEEDFLRAMNDIVPSSARSAVTTAASLGQEMSFLLGPALDQILKFVHAHFVPENSYILREEPRMDTTEDPKSEMVGVVVDSIKNGDEKSDTLKTSKVKKVSQDEENLQIQIFAHRPRLLLCGSEGSGHSMLASALLSVLERFPVFLLDLSSVFSNNSAKSVEECVVQSFTEAKRKLPSILYMPNVDTFWMTASTSVRLIFVNLLNDLPPALPLLLLGTATVEPEHLDKSLSLIFTNSCIEIPQPAKAERALFFQHLLSLVGKPIIKPLHKILPELPKAPLPEGVLQKEDEECKETIREFRSLLRELILRLLNNRKFYVFHKPVDQEEHPDYYHIIKQPLCLNMMAIRVEQNKYRSLQSFYDDIALIVKNAQEYNPADDPSRIFNKAQALLDEITDFIFELRKKQSVLELEKTMEKVEQALLEQDATERLNFAKLDSLNGEAEKTDLASQAEVPAENVENKGEEEKKEEQKEGEEKKEGKVEETMEEEKKEEEKGKGEEEEPKKEEKEEVLAVEFPKDEVIEVSVDKQRLGDICERLVGKTLSLGVDDLHRVYIQVRKLIFEHESDIDKSELLIKLSDFVDNLK